MKQRLTFLFLCCITWASAQFTAPETGELFRDDVLSRVDILIPADSLKEILKEGNEYKDYAYHATFIYDNGTIKDTLKDVGFRLRGNTSRLAQKKSFKIEFNEYVKGRKYYGVEKMNLNSQYLDPTISRGKIGADILREMSIPSIRSNHTLLYINNEFYGVYVNTENVDEEYVLKRYGNNNGNLYKCRYPADLKYLGTDADLYKFEVDGERPYTLKINEDEDNYSDLAHFIDVLNNTPTADLPCKLEPIFNVNAFLNQMVFDVLSGNWDGAMVSGNNYYLYHNTATDKLEFIPWDLDKTFGIDLQQESWEDRNIYDWSPQDSIKPLYAKIMAVPTYKDRFTFYMNETIENIFNSATLNTKWDKLQVDLELDIEKDTFYSKDFGYTLDDFFNGFDGTVTTAHTPINVREYVTERVRTAKKQMELNPVAPIISDIHAPTAVEIGKAINITAVITDEATPKTVQVCYTINGTETCVDMEKASDAYQLNFTAPSDVNTLTYTIQATDETGLTTVYPSCGTANIKVHDPNAITLAINEFLASNDAANKDEHGDYDDWVEIYNYGTKAVYLGDKYLTDDKNEPNQWQMPDINIEAGEFLLFWCDKEGSEGNMHTNFKLSSGGEYIGIFNSETSGYALIDGYEFGSQTTDVSEGRIPDGTGDFQTLSDISPAMSNESTAVNNLAALDLALTISPNPFHEDIHISIDNPSGHHLQLELRNILGQKMYQTSITQSKTVTLSQTHVPKGIYFLTIYHEQKVVRTEKLLKQ